MKTRTKKNLLSLLLVCAFLLPTTVANASDGAANPHLGLVRRVDSTFLQEAGVIEERCSPLVTPWGDGVLVEYYRNGTAVAYSVEVGNLVVEFAESESPYSKLDTSSGDSLYYDFAGYEVVNADFVQPQGESLQTTRIEGIDGSIKQGDELKGVVLPEVEKTLSNVSPHLQNGFLCGQTALSNVMWYWGSHGYSALTSGLTFTQIQEAITDLFGGSYANNRVLSVASTFASSRCGRYFTGGANWSPTLDTVVSEIESDRPCMVGFAKGSVYSDSEGHMTMGVGYLYDSSGVGYVRAVDGHSSSIVTKLWTQYNDCVIVLSIH